MTRSTLRVVITDCDLGSTEYEERILEEKLGAHVSVHTCRSAADVMQAAEGADALLVQWAPITRDVLSALPGCRLISRYGIGVDMIDVDGATNLGVAVANARSYCVEEVAAHAVGLLLDLNRGISSSQAAVRDGRWRDDGFFQPKRLSECVLGLIGLGRIGRRVAASFDQFGVRVVAFDPWVKEADLQIELMSLDRLLRESDLISLHCPLTAETQGLIGRAELSLVKPGAVLVNTARGGLVDEDALVAALDDGRLAAAGLDTFAVEPLPAASPLRSLPNVVLTPHTAWLSASALRDLHRETAANVVNFFQGRPVAGLLNPGVLDRPRQPITTAR